VIACGSQIIAEHKRSYEREATIYDPLHYLAGSKCCQPGSRWRREH
jgi:hypothetical protein